MLSWFKNASWEGFWRLLSAYSEEVSHWSCHTPLHNSGLRSAPHVDLMSSVLMVWLFGKGAGSRNMNLVSLFILAKGNGKYTHSRPRILSWCRLVQTHIRAAAANKHQVHYGLNEKFGSYLVNGLSAAGVLIQLNVLRKWKETQDLQYLKYVAGWSH